MLCNLAGQAQGGWDMMKLKKQVMAEKNMKIRAQPFLDVAHNHATSSS